MAVKTFAAIDVGSYEVSMKIFEVSKKNGMRQIDHIIRSIEMGTETYSSGMISYKHVEELCDTLREFNKIMQTYRVEDYKAYGTSAIRETKNTSILLDLIKQRTGIDVEVLSNSEQRFLDYKSIAFQGELFDNFIKKGTVILDVGGGSIQLSLFDEETLISTQNMKLGVLRLKERLNTLGASMRQYETLIDEICMSQLNTYKKLYCKNKEIENIIIVDDYISTAINRKSSEHIVKDTPDIAIINKYIEMIGNTSRSELAASLGMSEDDIPLFYISILLLRCVMSTTGARTIWTPGVTLCDGIAYEYAEESENIKTNHDFEKDILACAKQISQRYQGSKKRSETLRNIALTVFDATKEINGLTQRDRLLLEISTILHDCGKYISMLNLADCSYNIIKYTEIIGLSHKERMIIANVVRYNQLEFEYYDDLADKGDFERMDHMKTAKLTAILRLANGLDRSHKEKFKGVNVKVAGNNLEIEVTTDEDVTLEKGLFGARAKFFEEVYNIKPVIKQKRSF